MKIKLITTLAALTLAGTAAYSVEVSDSYGETDALVAGENEAQTMVEDPNIWLEEVEGEAALDWVRAQNGRSLDRLQADPLYEELQAKALEIVNSKERIPYGSIRDGLVYNFWQDETHVRGLWRRTTLESYAREMPDWEVLIDFDQLATEEGKNWVFKGAKSFSAPDNDERKWLISLSDGGKDAVEVREFDIESKTFVDGGFFVPEAKSNISWVDYDTLLVATDWGRDGSTLTESGYAFVLKRWKRGTSLAEAETVFKGIDTDVSVGPYTLELEDGKRLQCVYRAQTFYETKHYWIPEGEDEPVEWPLPLKVSIENVYGGKLLIALEQDWDAQGQGEFRSGDLVAFDVNEFLDTRKLPKVELVFRANERQAVKGVSVAQGAALLSINDNVRGRILKLEPGRDGWSTEPLDLPSNGQLALYFAAKEEDIVFINYEGFLSPDSLMSYSVSSGEIKTLKSLPTKFDSEGLVVEQKEALSKDGTKVPYFIVRQKDLPFDGSTSTLLYGYGGFQISMNPSYSALRGRLWLERGGAYVLANIRGGGEFGPTWHQAGLKTQRQVIYDDFIAIGEALIDSGLTSSKNLGIMGGSNGGLLMGVMLTQRPELWNAVVIQVPLLDMLRYHLLLAGASWVGEYGSPDDPVERAWLEKMSPYHNFDPEADYPEPFFVTSTKDDRVHPAHARKMAKLFEEAEQPFLYYENIDGGHSAAANLQETAKRVALEFTYLSEKLMSGESK